MIFRHIIRNLDDYGECLGGCNQNGVSVENLALCFFWRENRDTGAHRKAHADRSFEKVGTVTVHLDSSFSTALSLLGTKVSTSSGDPSSLPSRTV